MLWVLSRAGGGHFSSGRFVAGVVPGGTVWLFTDKAEAVLKAAALLNRG